MKYRVTLEIEMDENNPFNPPPPHWWNWTELTGEATTLVEYATVAEAAPSNEEP